jgi:splicing factor 3B subunit 4
MAHQGYGFCEFLTEEDAEYACKIMNQIKLWGKPIRVNKASSDKKQLDVGANLFIGNLDENVDERLLYDTFSAFGVMATTAKIARDPSNGKSKGYGFASYTDFESSDAAIESMNGQFLMNKAITVQYAFKKDGKGERHGTPAERLLAAQARKNNALPVSARPPPAPMAFGARPAMPFQGPYQGQFAGALAAAPPPPPPGFAPQGMMPPMMVSPMGMPGPPPMYGAPPPGFVPPPPPGFAPQGMPQGMPMMPPPPPISH